jgi:hypothetical protein
MPARLLDRSLPQSAPSTPKRPGGIPDPGYEAITRLTQLADSLSEACRSSRSRWKEPPLFFFDPEREAQRLSSQPVVPFDPLTAVAERIRAEMPLLCGSVEVRRVARGIEKLRIASETLAPMCAAAKDLVELLAVADDELILVLLPEARLGFRMAVRGVADLGQFHVLLAAAIAADLKAGYLPRPAIPDRFVAACRNSGPPIPAGIPMEMEARFQIYTPQALRADGTLPSGLEGCDHWLWPAMPLAIVPRMGGERVVLLGPPVYRQGWDVTVRFSGMPAELRLVESLGTFRVAEQLSRLTGNPIAPIPSRELRRDLSKAA